MIEVKPWLSTVTEDDVTLFTLTPGRCFGCGAPLGESLTKDSALASRILEERDMLTEELEAA